MAAITTATATALDPGRGPQPVLLALETGRPNETTSNAPPTPASSSESSPDESRDPIPPQPGFAGFDGPLDPGHPHNWSTRTKLTFVAIVNAAIFAVTFASGILGPAASVLAEQHNVSDVTMQLGVSLFVAGFAVGPLVWGPLIEAYGPNMPAVVGLFGCGLCHVPLGLATDAPTILVSRFFAGAFGSSIMTVGAGMVSELYGPIARGTVLAFNALFVNLGSVIAPIVGSYVVARHSWRWLAWITLIVFACVAPAAALFLKEAGPSRILAARAKRSRRARQRENNRDPQQGEPDLLEPQQGRIDFRTVVTKYLARPVALFVREPILIILTIYSTFVYGLLYMAYQLFPKAYESRGWAMDTATLPFVAVAVGLMVSPAVIAVFMTTWYKQRWLQRGRRSTPEDRLPPMILGACVLPPALVWFGWSMDSHWMSQVLASAFIGLGLQLVFVSALVYIVDVYMANVMPAIAGHVVMRSVFAASFPMWTGAMYERLGFKWMATALAAFAAIMAPFPILFFIFGTKIRSWSRYSVHQD